MHKHTLIWIITFGVITLMFVQLPQVTARRDSVLNTYSALVEVDALTKKTYVEAINDDRLVHGAIRGMMRELDPYSGYIAPSEVQAFSQRMQGSFVGVGVEIGMNAGRATVIAPFEGGPAAQAGVLPGDVIASVDGRNIEHLSIFDIEELIDGPPGTAVRFTLTRSGVDHPIELTVTRDAFKIETVSGVHRRQEGSWDYVIDVNHRIGYVRISSFHQETSHEFDQAMKALSPSALKGLILDLRFNPGGLMHSAIEIVDRFVQDGLILSTVTRRRVVKDYYASSKAMLPPFKLVVLINHGSASSAEIVAGALQDHGRAIIVGERSFGKGSVQRVVNLKLSRAAVKLTMAYYKLPHGRIVHRTEKTIEQDSWGVKPDTEIFLSQEEWDLVHQSRRMVSLSNSNGLANDSTPSNDQDSPFSIVRDRHIQKALELLRQ